MTFDYTQDDDSVTLLLVPENSDDKTALRRMADFKGDVTVSYFEDAGIVAIDHVK